MESKYKIGDEVIFLQFDREAAFPAKGIITEVALPRDKYGAQYKIEYKNDDDVTCFIFRSEKYIYNHLYEIINYFVQCIGECRKVELTPEEISELDIYEIRLEKYAKT